MVIVNEGLDRFEGVPGLGILNPAKDLGGVESGDGGYVGEVFFVSICVEVLVVLLE